MDSLFSNPPQANPTMPRTRYQGSKRRIVNWLGEHFDRLDFDTALDAFGGSGVVGYALKARGKRVTHHDLLACNQQIGLALIENDSATLGTEQVERLITPVADREYDDFIERTFGGIYYTDEENRWLDVVVQNIRAVSCRLTRAMAYYALFQSALAKRPYNLFHRRNLYLRTADVRRGFGNKATWDRPFADHFRTHASHADAAVFGGEQPCCSIQGDVADLEGEFDLVYIDPPYLNARGVGVDYAGFYHFLDGLIRYDEWADLIDYHSRHLRMRRKPSPWLSAREVHVAFRDLLERFADSVLVVSYRSDGIPSADELVSMVRAIKPCVSVYCHDRYRYALSTNKRSKEMLVVGTG